MPTVYTVAFSGDEFLMVFNEKRGGWEMPGGGIEAGESIENAAAREFREEAGYSIRIMETRDLGCCHVCAGVVLGRTDNDPEMRSGFFSDIPDRIFFDRAEYEDVVPWARSAVSKHC